MGYNVLIMERNHQGHRLTGVRVLLDALLDFNRTHNAISSITLATTQEGFDSNEFDVQLSDVNEHLQRLVLSPNKGAVGTLKAAWIKLQDWRAHIAPGKFDHVYIPYADGLLQVLSVAKLVPGFVTPANNVCIESIFMRGSFGYESAQARTQKVALFGVQHAPVHRVHLIDPLPYRFIQKQKPALVKKVKLLPDPITPTQAQDKQLARRALGLEPGCQWIGCIGVIDDRKGADKLIEAFDNAALAPNTRLLLAGKQSPALSALITAKANEQIVSINRYLTELELSQALGALDVVATPYPNFIGSASIVLRAAAGERYCLGSNSGWMNYVIPAFELGAVCNIFDKSAFAKALESALHESASYEPSHACKAFVHYGSLENVYAHWTDLVREKTGAPPDDNRVSWPSEQNKG